MREYKVMFVFFLFELNNMFEFYRCLIFLKVFKECLIIDIFFRFVICLLV